MLNTMGSADEDKSPGGRLQLEKEGEYEWHGGPPAAELRHRPKDQDPRTKHKYNPFCRLFYL